jgi:S-layer family protein
MRLTRVFIAVLFLSASAVWGSDKFPVAANTYGTTAMTWMTLSAWDFHPRESATTYNFNGTGILGIYNLTGPGVYEAPVKLPEGAVVSVLELSACDTNGGTDMTVVFVASDKTGPYASFGPTSTSGSTGCQVVSNAAGNFTAFTVNNDTTYYTIEAYFNGVTDPSLTLNSVRVGYNLQVSPPPGTATYNDVPPTHLFYQYVEALAAAGITAGCGGGNFCPDAAVTRGQMAVFLSRALGLHWAP